MPDAPRRVFNGRYEIIRRIARGGMAEVYLARDNHLDRPVALKVLFPELSTDRSFVERFRREAQSAANLTHPNIVSVYDWGEEDGTYFIVMELVDGRPLSTTLRAEGTLLADRAAEIGAAVAAALAFAHQHGVVHRDVKPGNVLIDRSGHVKVADFGIARAAGTAENLTQTGAVMGTATYFSPEQAQGQPVDARSDVYSLGVVLYEMVAGQPPFEGDSPVAVALQHVRGEIPAPSQLNPNVPKAMEAIILQALARDPDDRYASAEELRADLLRFRQGRAVAAVPPVAAAAATTAVPASPPPATQAIPATTVADGPSPGPRTGAYVALLFIMLAALAVLLFLFGRSVGIFGDQAAADTLVPSVISQTADQAKKTLEDAGFEVVTEFAPNEDYAENVVFNQDPEAGTKAPSGSKVTIKVSQGAAPVEVPDVVGRDIGDATEAITNAGFLVKQEPKADDSAPPGEVLAQDPKGGDQAPKGSTVTVTVSSGKEKVSVPDVVGDDADAAIAELARADLNPKRATESSTSIPEGKVIRTDPSAGTVVDKGSTVNVVVSSGPPQTTVPDVVGMKRADAEAKLKAAGFKVAVETVATENPSEDGRVVDQDPNAGDKRDQGSTVTITVAQLAP